MLRMSSSMTTILRPASTESSWRSCWPSRALAVSDRSLERPVQEQATSGRPAGRACGPAAPGRRTPPSRSRAVVVGLELARARRPPPALDRPSACLSWSTSCGGRHGRGLDHHAVGTARAGSLGQHRRRLSATVSTSVNALATASSARLALAGPTSTIRRSAWSTKLFTPCEGRDHHLALDRLVGEAEGADGEAQALLVVGRDDVHRDVPRLRRALQEVEQGQAVHVRQADVEHDGVGPEALGQRRRRRALAGDHALEAGLAHQGRAGSRRSAGRPRRSARPDRRG